MARRYRRGKGSSVWAHMAQTSKVTATAVPGSAGVVLSSALVLGGAPSVNRHLKDIKAAVKILGNTNVSIGGVLYWAKLQEDLDAREVEIHDARRLWGFKPYVTVYESGIYAPGIPNMYWPKVTINPDEKFELVLRNTNVFNGSNTTSITTIVSATWMERRSASPDMT